MKAEEARKIADAAANNVRSNLLNIALNKIKSVAAQNMYSVYFTYPKHQVDFIKTELEKLGYVVNEIPSLTNTTDVSLTIDFSQPKTE